MAMKTNKGFSKYLGHPLMTFVPDIAVSQQALSINQQVETDNEGNLVVLSKDMLHPHVR